MSSQVLRIARPTLLAFMRRPRLSSQLTKRNIFYTQRRRPSTAEENLAFVTGLGVLASAISLGLYNNVFSTSFGAENFKTVSEE